MIKKSIPVYILLLVVLYSGISFCENAKEKYPYLFEGDTGDYYDIIILDAQGHWGKDSIREGYFVNCNVLVSLQSTIIGDSDCVIIFEKLPLSLFNKEITNQNKRIISGKLDPNSEFLTRISVILNLKIKKMTGRSKTGTRTIVDIKQDISEIALLPSSSAENEDVITDKRGTEYDYLRIVFNNGVTIIYEDVSCEILDDYIICQIEDDGEDITFTNEIIDLINKEYIKTIEIDKDEDFSKPKIVFENKKESTQQNP